MSPSPEAEARFQIAQQLEGARWVVQDVKPIETLFAEERDPELRDFHFNRHERSLSENRPRSLIQMGTTPVTSTSSKLRYLTTDKGNDALSVIRETEGLK